MRKECMCHVQKWLRTRLKTPQRTLKGKILSDGKIPEAVLKQKITQFYRNYLFSISFKNCLWLLLQSEC